MSVMIEGERLVYGVGVSGTVSMWSKKAWKDVFEMVVDVEMNRPICYPCYEEQKVPAMGRVGV